jgi:hypothetical protein
MSEQEINLFNRLCTDSRCRTRTALEPLKERGIGGLRVVLLNHGLQFVEEVATIRVECHG